MAVQLVPRRDSTPENPADRDYFLDANRQLTTDPDKAAYWLVRKGIEIPPEVSEKYGIGRGKKEGK